MPRGSTGSLVVRAIGRLRGRTTVTRWVLVILGLAALGIAGRALAIYANYDVKDVGAGFVYQPYSYYHPGGGAGSTYYGVHVEVDAWHRSVTFEEQDDNPVYDLLQRTPRTDPLLAVRLPVQVRVDTYTGEIVNIGYRGHWYEGERTKGGTLLLAVFLVAVGLILVGVNGSALLGARGRGSAARA